MRLPDQVGDPIVGIGVNGGHHSHDVEVAQAGLSVLG